MAMLDPVLKAWNERARFYSYEKSLVFTSAGLCLGAGTVLVKAAAGRVRLSGSENRILHLLGVAHGFEIGAEILPHLDRAARAWNDGDVTRALIHVAFARLPPLADRAGARRLFLADGLLRAGMAPGDLGKLAGFTDAGAVIWKVGYNPAQLRNPHGPGGGQWTRTAGIGAASGQNAAFVQVAGAVAPQPSPLRSSSPEPPIRPGPNLRLVPTAPAAAAEAAELGAVEGGTMLGTLARGLGPIGAVAGLIAGTDALVNDTKSARFWSGSGWSPTRAASRRQRRISMGR